MTFDLIEWIEAIHQAIMETRTLVDFDGLQLWWIDTLENGISQEGRKA